MANEEVSIRQLVSRVQIGNFRGYLIDRGWSEMPSRYVDHVYFQGAIHDGGAPYDLYLPTSPDVPKYHATLMRAIYKLCGIEDREPQDIARDVIATNIAPDRPAAGAKKTRLRISNSGSSPLQLRIDSPLREHEMLPGEAIELICDVAITGSLEIEQGDGSLTILTSGRQ
ncbi:MAG TPA: hypothetical protein VGK58_21755 [Lacipirellulaceae bacterium]